MKKERSELSGLDGDVWGFNESVSWDPSGDLNE